MSERSSTGFFPNTERAVCEVGVTPARDWMLFVVKASVPVSVAAMATMSKAEEMRRRDGMFVVFLRLLRVALIGVSCRLQFFY